MTTDTNPRPAVLADYAAVVWRHRLLVLVLTLVGGVIGALVIPATLSPHRTFTATQRLTVVPLNGESSDSSSTSSTKTAPSVTSRYADLTAMSAAITALGPLAGQLDATRHARPQNRGAAALSAFSAKPVTGTQQVDFSFNDKSSRRAAQALQAYVTAYVAQRNIAAAQHAAHQAGVLRRQAKQQLATLSTLSAQADAERAASGGHVVSTLTASELDSARARYEATQAAQDAQLQQQALRGVPTALSGPIVVHATSRPTARSVLLVSGLLMGLLLGIGVALLSEAFRRRLLTPTEAEETSDLPVLAVVPSRGRVREANIVDSMPFCPAAEGYQRARAVLQLAGLGSDIGALTVLGAEPRSGKTSFALNLAQSMANQGIEVVLVSADLRNPKLDAILFSDVLPGLADLARYDAAEVDDLLIEVSPHLWVLPAGRPRGNPAELLSGARMRELLTVLRSRGVVIVDTPPALVSGEALALAEAADASVVVARAGHTTRSGLVALAGMLERLRLRQLGLVLIGFDGPTYSSYYGTHRATHSVIDLVPDHTQNGHHPVGVQREAATAAATPGLATLRRRARRSEAVQ